MSLSCASDKLEFWVWRPLLHCRHNFKPTQTPTSRNRGIPSPRPTPRPTLKLVWSVLVVSGAGIASGFVAAASDAIAASVLLVVAEVCEEVASVVEVLLVSEVEVLLGLKAVVSLVLASVRVLRTTLLDVLEVLDVVLEEIGSVMLK